MKIKIADLVVGERLRETKQLEVNGIAASFKSEGQLQPILVLGNQLIAGAHRVAAAKLLGWEELEAEEFDLQGETDPELIEHTCVIAQVDENLVRRELDAAEMVIFVDERTKRTAARIIRRKVLEAEAAQAAAPTRNDGNKAIKRKTRAKKSEAKLVPVSSAAADIPGTTRRDRLPNDVLDAVVKETGLHRTTIQEAAKTAHQIGRDNLKVMANTSMSSRAEMRGFMKLQKLSPDDAARCIKLAVGAKEKGVGGRRKDGPSGFSPSGKLGELIKKQSVDAKNAAQKTDEGRLSLLMECTDEATNVLASMRGCLGGSPPMDPTIKAKLEGVYKLQSDLAVFRTILRGVMRPIKQKRTGAEHKYVDTAAEGPTREEAAAELVEHDKAIKKKLKKSKASA